MRITMRIEPESGTGAFGIRVRCANGGSGRELIFEPGERSFRYAAIGRGAESAAHVPNRLENVSGLEKSFDLDVIVKDDFIDVCIDECRTLFTWNRDSSGKGLCFFARNCEINLNAITIRPIS